MIVRIVTKYGDCLKEYYNGSGAFQIPLVNDTIVVDKERYKVVNRTFDVDTYSAILEVWKAVEDSEESL